MEEKTRLISSKEPAEQAKTVITEVSKSKKLPKFLKVAGVTAVGAAVGFGIFGLMGMTPPTPIDATGEPVDLDKPEIPENPVEATKVSDDMSYSEAFKTARAEVGATGFFEYKGHVYGTMYESEMAQLTPEERKEMLDNVMSEHGDTQIADKTEPAIIIHDVAPVAVGVSDDMSFKDAFAVGRAEVGPGGTFEWNGKTFNTYTKEEFTAMSDEQKSDFVDSTGLEEIQLTTIGNEDVDIVKIDGGPENVISVPDSTGNLISEEYVMLPETGENVLVGLFEVDGAMVLKVDTDNDGTYDTNITQDEAGNYTVTNDAGETAYVTQDDIISYQENNNTYVDDYNPTNSSDDIIYSADSSENDGSNGAEKNDDDVVYSTNDVNDSDASSFNEDNNFSPDFDNHSDTFMS